MKKIHKLKGNTEIPHILIMFLFLLPFNTLIINLNGLSELAYGGIFP